MNQYLKAERESGEPLPIYEQELIRAMEVKYGPLPAMVSASLAYLSLFVRAGHVYLPLDRTLSEWRELLDLEERYFPNLENVDPDVLENHPITGSSDGDAPLVFVKNHLSFRIHHQQERRLAEQLNRLAKSKVAFPTGEVRENLQQMFPNRDEPVNWQRVAAAEALANRLLILSGGPGTGKTTTVAKIIQLMQTVIGQRLSVAVTAPTGKAAARLNDSLLNQISGDLSELNGRLWSGTLHRLLYGRGDRKMLPPVWTEPLLYDLVVVDEASMVDLSMMYRLMEHLGEETRLILLGDHHQLASVEAGAVLSEICRNKRNLFLPETAEALQRLTGYSALPTGEPSDLENCTVYLEKGYRFDSFSGIGQLAEALRNGNSEETAEIVTGEWPDLSIVDFSYGEDAVAKLSEQFVARYKEAELLNPEEMLDFWSREIWLTLPKRGVFGSVSLNRFVENWLEREEGIRRLNGWYHGRPVMITRNDYTLEVYNGDFGVCIEKEPGYFELLLQQPGHSARAIPVERLGDTEPACFLTVHKSQGSEFDRVHLLLPKDPSRFMTRELVYTAITRARSHCLLYGDPQRVVEASENPTERFSSLSSYLF